MIVLTIKMNSKIFESVYQDSVSNTWYPVINKKIVIHVCCFIFCIFLSDYLLGVCYLVSHILNVDKINIMRVKMIFDFLDKLNQAPLLKTFLLVMQPCETRVAKICSTRHKTSCDMSVTFQKSKCFPCLNSNL